MKIDIFSLILFIIEYILNMCTPEQQKAESLFFEISKGRPQSLKSQVNLCTESEPSLPTSGQLLSSCTGYTPHKLSCRDNSRQQQGLTTDRHQMLHTRKKTSVLKSKQGDCLPGQQ
ncbi:hypothetical protein H1C71_038342 [Ictidomys tridecemlineatus]|nr:hypothetical protein H1C71_038342 [Ictidomys tridecemlineatus]